VKFGVGRQPKKRTKIVLASEYLICCTIGHVSSWKAAKKAGGKSETLVIVARDSTVQDAKGRRPIMPENQSLALVESLKSGRRRSLGFGRTLTWPMSFNAFKPDVIALGYDQEKMEKRVREYNRARTD